MTIPACPICFNANTHLINKRMILHRCDECRHTFTEISRAEEESYNQAYFLETHKQWFENPDYALFERVYDNLGALIKPRFKTLLDVGCGTGNFLKHLSAQDDSLNLTGIDLIENSDAAINFIKGDFIAYNSTEKFDVLTNFMVIEHVPDPHAFVQKISQLLHHQGLLVVNTINNNGLMYRIARWLNYFGFTAPHDRLYDHHHLQHYSTSSLKKLLDMEGFVVNKSEVHNYPMKAVDVPGSNQLLKKVYLLITGLIFAVSGPFLLEMHQTLYCSRKV